MTPYLVSRPNGSLNLWKGSQQCYMHQLCMVLTLGNTSVLNTKICLNTGGVNMNRYISVVRDNAANMVKAMCDASYPDLGCFAHTFQLTVHAGVLSQRAVIDTLVVCSHIVGHFKHSYSRLKESNKILDFNNIASARRINPLEFLSLYVADRQLRNRKLHLLLMQLSITSHSKPIRSGQQSHICL